MGDPQPQEHGPWEDYQAAPSSQTAEHGPWEDYATKPVPAPNAGLAPPAGAPPSKTEAAKTITSGEGPVARGMTSFETHLSDMAPPQAPAAAGMGSYGSAVTMAHPEMQAKMDPRGVVGLSPIVKTDTGETGGVDIGATAANLLPWVIDPAGGGIGESAAGSLAKGFGEAMPSRARAAATLEGVKRVAGDVPVETAKLQQIVNSALEQKSRGGGPLPPPMKAFVKRMNDPSLPPVTYGELRDFASNAGRLSVKASRAMSPTMKRYLGDFARETGESNSQAAASVGQGAEYNKGMTGYRRAARMADFGQNSKDLIKSVAKKAVPIAGAYYAGRELLDRR